jgi:hypothetical protein
MEDRSVGLDVALPTRPLRALLDKDRGVSSWAGLCRQHGARRGCPAGRQLRNLCDLQRNRRDACSSSLSPAVLLARAVHKLCWVGKHLGLGREVEDFCFNYHRVGSTGGWGGRRPGDKNSTRRPEACSVCGQLSATHPPGSVPPPSQSH